MAQGECTAMEIPRLALKPKCVQFETTFMFQAPPYVVDRPTLICTNHTSNRDTRIEVLYNKAPREGP